MYVSGLTGLTAPSLSLTLSLVGPGRVMYRKMKYKEKKRKKNKCRLLSYHKPQDIKTKRVMYGVCTYIYTILKNSPHFEATYLEINTYISSIFTFRV